MNGSQAFALLNTLWGDLNAAGFYWRAGALAAILGLSWWITYHVRRGTTRGMDEGNALLAFGAGGLKRIAFPLIALILTNILFQILEYHAPGHLALFEVASLLLFSLVQVRMFVYVLRCVFPSGGFLRHSEHVVAYLIWGGMILRMTGLADPIIEALRQIRFGIGSQQIDLWRLLQGIAIICVALLVALWISRLIERRLKDVDGMNANLREVLSRLVKALLLVIALLFSLSMLGIDVTALSVFSGALAVGLGLGLQRIASNYVSGFIILLDHSISLGNLIALDDNTSGTVTRITTRYTVLRLLNGTEIIIPNEYLVVNMVRNLSFSNKQLRAATTVGVAYDTDIDRVRERLVEIALAHPRVLADPKPGVSLKEFADNAIVLELGFWVGDPERGTGGIRSDINFEILRVFRQEGIEIPFPQREVRIVQDSKT